MKYNIVLFSLSLIIICQSRAMYNTSNNDLDQASYHQIDDTIIRLKEAIHNKDITEIKKIEINPLWKEELYRDALIELKKTPGPIQRIAQATGYFSMGLLCMTAGTFNWLSYYVAEKIDSSCKNNCSLIGIDKPICKKNCEIVSQPNIHSYEPFLGSLTLISGMAISFYGPIFCLLKCRDLKKAHEVLEYIEQTQSEFSPQDLELAAHSEEC